MKGLLKGLLYISEIFEADNDKEPEIQIGAPTDVKHVAHIGCDGPSSNAPSWMNDFQGSSDNGGTSESMRTPDRHGKSKQSKKQASNLSVNSSDTDTKPRKNKTLNSDNESHGRRAKNATAESPSQESGAKKNRRKKRTSTRDSSNAD
uniref:ROP-interactive CRIB motif-containing protein B n=1 Tax=Helianthus annuus TaxID=4232 RepID=I6QN73_HELAN|nr:ROP-interactive CRIB motif-containing protein B [Helianthus annuus]